MKNNKTDIHKQREKKILPEKKAKRNIFVFLIVFFLIKIKYLKDAL